ncbi:type II toxin-antitoxin system PemK/MazF family toxin [Halorubrum sp. Atlit-26R]|uniref:type II toxin-antitoxin system PemK/MazF family toxin n=1 Tax=Halorubrum sp. Atlit-26R TaxID=2282128 RepID=UPI000EF24BFD|nr:type II toxin-antitoxin system PemK/MazF family toxin [Halorubrum sp. Atlit-26R]RLM68643.1 type II toxin-antitoxin system PemK/MazF family toxin [Halorubrum sp. Atlit-26R]
MPTISRGDVVWVTFPDPEDVPEEEFENPHPAVVVQNDSRNHKYDTTIVAPLSTSQESSEEFADVEISSSSEGVDDDSIAKLGLLSAVSVPGRIMDESEDPSVWKMGELSASKMAEIEARMEVLLGIA